MVRGVGEIYVFPYYSMYYKTTWEQTELAAPLVITVPTTYIATYPKKEVLGTRITQMSEKLPLHQGNCSPSSDGICATVRTFGTEYNLKATLQNTSSIYWSILRSSYRFPNKNFRRTVKRTSNTPRSLLRLPSHRSAELERRLVIC